MATPFYWRPDGLERMSLLKINRKKKLRPLDTHLTSRISWGKNNHNFGLLFTMVMTFFFFFRDIFSLGFGPFRWVCTSGLPEDLRQTDAIATDVLQGIIKGIEF